MLTQSIYMYRANICIGCAFVWITLGAASLISIITIIIILCIYIVYMYISLESSVSD